MVLGPSPVAERSVEESGGDVKWLPFHRFEINSPLDRQAALAAMAAHTEERKWFRWRWPNSANDDRFEGDVTIDGFNVCRIIGYRNSFLPVVEGIVHSSGRGSRIEVRMRMFAFVYVFVAVWVIAVGSMLFTDFWPFALGMLVFLYAMTMGAFWFEASKQEQTLRKIFQAN
jgi:hypothetical protein